MEQLKPIMIKMILFPYKLLMNQAKLLPTQLPQANGYSQATGSGGIDIAMVVTLPMDGRILMGIGITLTPTAGWTPGGSRIMEKHIILELMALWLLDGDR